jgi:hypothetical protein
MRSRVLIPAVAAALIAASVAALAGNTTLFSSTVGDIVFPFTPPARDGSAGAIDNMIIGATTPRAGTFTTISGSGTMTPAGITGGATPFPIAGKAAASASSAGGAITIAGAAGGATSGAGGALSMTGGAGTAGNSAGGAVSHVGGAGQGSAAGGASSVVGGAGGATGNGGATAVTGGAAGATSGTGGAVNIAGGASPTLGVGGAVVLAGGASAGGTNAGANIDLNPSAAVSTGIPGKVRVNSDACLIPATYYFTGTPAATSQVFFLATRAMIVTNISQVHSAAAGGTSTLDVTKDTSTGAPASGSALGQAAFNLNGTANTVQNATLNATIATITLAAGDRLSVKFNHAIQSSAGVVVTACMAPL